MARLNTPFGYVTIMIDGWEIEYYYEQLAVDERLCPEVVGRYKILVEFEPDGDEHSIECILLESLDYNRVPESGEGIECQSFYNNDRIKLSIGLKCEAGTKASDNYDVDYLENGMAYLVKKNTKTNKYIFGIAWIDDIGWDDERYADNDRDVQTWFAADPTIM